MASTPLRQAALHPHEKADLATTARLLSCLVTETLAAAQFFPLQAFQTIGFCVIYVQDKVPACVHHSDILAVVPLTQIPILKVGSPQYEVALLDPMDMSAVVFEVDSCKGEELSEEASNISGHVPVLLILAQNSRLRLAILRLLGLVDTAVLRISSDVLTLWRKFGVAHLPSEIVEDIAEELVSAVEWQAWSYENPPLVPDFSSPSIDWEQSIVEGHPTHPMHKTRRTLPPIEPMLPGSYDLYNPLVRIIALPSESLHIAYDFAKCVLPILRRASFNAGKPLNIPEGYLAMPVHELQIPHIAEKFQEAIILPPEFCVPALAQQSIRSLVLPGTLDGTSLKLGVGIKLTSAVRTITPFSAYLGPRFSANVVPVLTMDRRLLTVARELASVVHANPDVEIAKHCSAIVREAYENTSEARGERLIVCTSLVESGHRGYDGHLPAVIRVFRLNTTEKRIQWLDHFVDVFFRAFLPPMIHNGVAFECHPQNTVARFDIKTGELLGFIIRDFGGIRVHPETLKSSTGVQLDFMEGHWNIAHEMEDVYVRMYHTMFHNHLQQLIRILGLHYDGKGWDIVRKRLDENIPKGHPLHKTWLSLDSDYFPGKCFMRMRFAGVYRSNVHGPFPNLLLYKGVSTVYSKVSTPESN